MKFELALLDLSEQLVAIALMRRLEGSVAAQQDIRDDAGARARVRNKRGRGRERERERERTYD